VRQLVDLARSQIPGALDPTITWHVSRRFDSWGVADWYNDTVYISPDVPRRRVADVVRHEYAHILSVRAYGGRVDEAVKAMNTYFGGAGLAGAERAADCMSRLLGARWTHYTACPAERWRSGARRLMQQRRL
jgi:hypothetical protein